MQHPSKSCGLLAQTGTHLPAVCWQPFVFVGKESCVKGGASWHAACGQPYVPLVPVATNGCSTLTDCCMGAIKLAAMIAEMHTDLQHVEGMKLSSDLYHACNHTAMHMLQTFSVRFFPSC